MAHTEEAEDREVLPCFLRGRIVVGDEADGPRRDLPVRAVAVGTRRESQIEGPRSSRTTRYISRAAFLEVPLPGSSSSSTSSVREG